MEDGKGRVVGVNRDSQLEHIGGEIAIKIHNKRNEDLLEDIINLLKESRSTHRVTG